MAGASDEVLRRAADLARLREPFALATVVWRRRPTSGKPGVKALVTREGQLHGWIGGACAQPAVIREGLAALERGTPRLLCLGLEGDFPGADPWRVVEPITCSSEGAMEIFVEPQLPRPQVVTIGDEPVARALREAARAVGFETVAVSLDGHAEAPVAADRVLRSLALEEAPVDAGSFVVVATMGQYDEDAVAAALGTDAPYVALVASRTRGDTVRAYLERHGHDAEQLARLRAPAGLDLGAIAHEEIAIAILAEIIALKAEGMGAQRAAPRRAPEQAVDPICGMTVQVVGAHHTAEYQGQTFYFCCAGCKERFLEQPASYV